ncbi:urease accessory protein UreD [Hansschlegelia quercus]|uniref:Urease accessory protein UreD n=1 Tax=Hansschlegelia quercus TaxID=2528245 RepID=A0A4Q9GKX9_9HYPH|nr:urease accessory protein UreD [Hansschlegelia quercus]TBN54872.1 urease accessory protein UreD [Hansschlegelia quercus]
MYASASPSEVLEREPPQPSQSEDASRRQRADGSIVVRAEASRGVSRAARVAESGAARLRLPRSEHGLDGVMLNVAGGLACGDRMRVAADVGPGAALTLSTPGAERVYRSDGPVTEVSTRLAIEPGGALAWVPQETILFDHARLARRLDADIARDGRLTVYEAVMFGRTARGETVESGQFDDCWRVRRDNKLVFADRLRIAGAVRELMAKRTVAAGATTLATLLHVAPDAEALLDPVRAALEGHPAVESGVSAWNGMLVVRFLAARTEALRDASRSVLPLLLGRPLPRVWSC